MITSKKKGQISVEALIIVGVLVVGGIIFATVFLNQMNNQAKQASDLSGLTDSFLNDLGGWNTPGTPGTPGTGSTPTCSDGIRNQGEGGIDCGGPCIRGCVIPNTCNNGAQDNGETGEDCGGPCPPCPTPGTLRIDLVLNPNSSSSINTNFGIHVLMTNATGQPKEVLKSIEIRKSGATTDKCSFNGVNASSFNNLNIPFNGVREMVLSFSCKEDGNYSFAIEAGILGNTTPEYNDTKNVVKEIKSTAIGCAVPGVCGPFDSCPNCPECCLNLTPKFSISIISPTEGQAYFDNQNIQLKAEEIGVGATGISCEWYIGKESIPAEKSCDLSYNLAAFKSGEYKVSVYATREKDGYILTSSDNRNIRIYEYDPSATYLSDPGTQFFGKEFNLKVSSLNEQNVIGASNISFSGINCDIDLTRVSTVFSEEVSGSTVYYKLFPTTCNDVSYSGPGILSPVNAIFNGSNYPFYVGYDLALNFGACSVAGSSYGRLNACVLQTSGSSYNEDYWKPSSYGFLKIAVDVSKNESKNNYGELKVYID